MRSNASTMVKMYSCGYPQDLECPSAKRGYQATFPSSQWPGYEANYRYASVFAIYLFTCHIMAIIRTTIYESW